MKRLILAVATVLLSSFGLFAQSASQPQLAPSSSVKKNEGKTAQNSTVAKPAPVMAASSSVKVGPGKSSGKQRPVPQMASGARGNEVIEQEKK